MLYEYCVLLKRSEVTVDNAQHANERAAMNTKIMNSGDWVRLIGGGFAQMTAPFAVHPKDRERANEYLKQAKAHGLTISDAVDHAREYLRTASGWPTDEEKQIQRVKKFFMGKLP